MNKYLQNLFITIPVILFSLFRPAYSQIKAPKPLAVGYSVGISGITPKAMDHAQSVGIDYVETSINSYIDQNTLEFKYSDEQIISRIQKAKKALDDAGIEVWSIHMPFGKTIDISFPDDEERKRVLTLHKKVIQFCKILEPKVILFHPSWYLGLNEREIRKSRLIESAVKLNKEVRRIGAIMVIENMLGPQLKAGVDRERPLCRSVEETVEIMNKLPKTIYSAVDMNHIKNPEILIRAMGSTKSPLLNSCKLK